MTSRRTLFASALALLTFLPASAAAQTLRYSANVPGKVIGTGNALGLSKELNANGPGTHDSIGTFISLDPTSVDNVPADPANPWPLGTTFDWTKNGSNATLTLPIESDVLYAELVWGGSSSYADEDVTGSLDSQIALTSGSMTIMVSPDPTTALTIAQTAQSGFAANYYMRSADVTAFVKTARNGTYAVTGVPATQPETINSLNAAGWSLIVAVRDATEPVRNLSVFVGGSFVDENSQQDYAVSGLCTPTGGPVQGTVVISAIEGDANLTGDQLLIGPSSAGPFVNLSGPNNPEDNFFCSQINGADGMVDTSGSFGNMNHDAASGTNIAGGRQSWDVTTVGVSSMDGQLDNNQTSAVFRTITTGDSYVPIVAAFAIDVNAPDFTKNPMIVPVPATVHVGDDLELTLDVTNSGFVTASNVALVMPLDPGLSLVSFKMQGQAGDINGNPVNAAKLASGAAAGNVAPGQSRHVVIDLHVDGPPSGDAFSFRADWDYAFEVCAGGTPTPETFSQFTDVAFKSSATGAGGGNGNAGGSSGTHGSMSNGAGGRRALGRRR